MKLHFWILVALVFLLTTFSAVRAAPRQQAENLLDNPSLERPFPNGIADQWQNWFRNDPADEKDAECLNGYHFRPKWNQESGNTDFIYEGFSAQYVGNNWDTWQGGVYQTVAVTPGITYRFTFYARVRGSNEVGPSPSEATLQANVRAGLAPNGSDSWNDGDVVWGNPGSPHDSWQQFSVEAVATGDQMSVFTAADWGVPGMNQCRQFLDAWFDAAELTAVSPPATDTPIPLPTTPPLPTATSTPNIPPTATLLPTATAVPEDTPLPGGTVCVNAFADDNANGLRDGGEGYIAGISFQVGNLDRIVGQGLSKGTADPICFAGIAPGNYQVSQIVPTTLQMTTAPNASIQVEDGKTYGVEFGSRLVGISYNDTSSPDTIASNVTLPTAESGAAASALGLGLSPWVLGGLVVLVIGVVAVGALIFLALRRQAE